MTRKNPDFSRWAQVLRKLAPVSLDTAGTMLLSGSAMLLFGVAVGLAALGVGVLVLNRVHNG